MKRRQSKTETIGVVTLTESYYDSGMIEIGVYRPEMIKRAGNVFCAVVTKPCPTGKWIVHTNVNRAHVGRNKTRAINFAVEYAQRQHAAAIASIEAAKAQSCPTS